MPKCPSCEARLEELETESTPELRTFWCKECEEEYNECELDDEFGPSWRD